MGLWMGSLDRSREGEDVGVGLAHVGGLVQVLEGPKAWSIKTVQLWQYRLTSRCSRPARGTGSTPAVGLLCCKRLNQKT